MGKIKPALALALLVAFGISFHNFSMSEPAITDECLAFPTLDFSDTDRDGKLNDAVKLKDTYTITPWEDLGFPVITEELAIALHHQLHVLQEAGMKDGKWNNSLDLTYNDMERVIKWLISRTNTQPDDLHMYLDAWQTRGEDKRGNVFFTGYFTPALKVRQKQDAVYKYPLYDYPENWKGTIPSREQIDKHGALRGSDLELAYAANKFDVYVMQLQGSGMVEFLDTGERLLMRYAGENGHRYRNIQRFFRNRNDLSLSNLSLEGIRRFLAKNPHMTDSVLYYNPSYTFFTPKKGLVKGAGEVPLMADISIAADPRYFPLGSVVLAAVPVTQNGKVTHHEYRILLPQDVGGAIKGAGHVDIYCGNGDIGWQKAANMHHYGRMWVLLPKKNEQVAMNGE